MKRRKHRLVVEMTTSHPLTEKKAAQALRLLLDERLDLQAKPIWPIAQQRAHGVYCDKLSVKEFSKVYQAQRAHDKEREESLNEKLE